MGVSDRLSIIKQELRCVSVPVMSRTSPGPTVNAQNADRRHSTTFISTPDWSVTTMDARGTKVPAAGPDFTCTPTNQTLYETLDLQQVVQNVEQSEISAHLDLLQVTGVNHRDQNRVPHPPSVTPGQQRCWTSETDGSGDSAL